MSRRDEVLAAAVEVAGTQGVRRLTHRGVDAHGGLPPGTTSNFFRSRAALVEATFAQLAEIMSGIIAMVGATPVADAEGLAQTLGTNLAYGLGPGRTIAAGLSTMFNEAALNEELQAAAAGTSRLWRDAMEKLLRSAGVTDLVEERARYLLSFADGLIADQLALREPDFDAVAAFRMALAGFFPA
jgi:DNA-binding transcriptional regulator YbjK